jgi:lysophospholipase L1-like esterase
VKKQNQIHTLLNCLFRFENITENKQDKFTRMFWYEDEIKRLEASSPTTNKNGTVFYGSSTIRLWDTLQLDFPNLQAANLGFGGSTLAACVWFFTRVMKDYHPNQLVVYAGDNDLGDGRHPEEVFIFFKQLTICVAEQFGNIPCHFISIKPSVSRWNLAGEFKYANSLIATEIAENHHNWNYIDIFNTMLDTEGKPKSELYLADGLHLSKQGYDMWKTIVAEKINVD